MSLMVILYIFVYDRYYWDMIICVFCCDVVENCVGILFVVCVMLVFDFYVLIDVIVCSVGFFCCIFYGYFDDCEVLICEFILSGV